MRCALNYGAKNYATQNWGSQIDNAI